MIRCRYGSKVWTHIYVYPPFFVYMGPRIGPIYTPESAEFPLGATPVLANLSQNGVHHFNVEGAAYHSTGHSAAWRCTLSAEKTGMRVQQ